MAEHRERSATLKRESDRACHETGDRCRGAYHRHQLTPMGNKMRQGAGRRPRRKEADDAQVPQSPRDRAAERQETNRIHAEMEDVAVNEPIGYQGPDILASSAPQYPHRQPLL